MSHSTPPLCAQNSQKAKFFANNKLPHFGAHLTACGVVCFFIRRTCFPLLTRGSYVYRPSNFVQCIKLGTLCSSKIKISTECSAQTCNSPGHFPMVHLLNASIGVWIIAMPIYCNFFTIFDQVCDFTEHFQQPLFCPMLPAKSHWGHPILANM